MATRLTEEQIADVIHNLERAEDNHRRWLQQLHTSALCRQPFPVDVYSGHAHCECKFGKWYYGNALDVLHTHPDYLELDGLHRAMHDSARAMANRLDSGQILSVAEYTEFVDRQRIFSQRLLGLRDQLREFQLAFDGLTGVMTRGPFMQAMEAEMARLKRDEEIACVAILDLDHFKAINDQRGHLMGDKVLRLMGQYLLSHRRTYDSVCRYGGEEFLLCLPYTDEETALAIMERIRLDMGSLSGTGDDLLDFEVTASAGIARLDSSLSIEENLARADQALYAAKAAGRNCVMTYGSLS